MKLSTELESTFWQRLAAIQKGCRSGKTNQDNLDRLIAIVKETFQDFISAPKQTAASVDWIIVYRAPLNYSYYEEHGIAGQDYQGPRTIVYCSANHLECNRYEQKLMNSLTVHDQLLEPFGKGTHEHCDLLMESADLQQFVTTLHGLVNAVQKSGLSIIDYSLQSDGKQIIFRGQINF